MAQRTERKVFWGREGGRWTRGGMDERGDVVTLDERGDVVTL
jgi:hypothetical protein